MIEPYYQSDDGAVVLYCADCLAVMREMEAGSVDAVVTDPPYGIDHDTDYTRFSGGTSNKRNTFMRIANDAEPFDPTPFLGFPKVAMCGANCYSNRLPLGSWLIWCKKPDSNLGNVLSDAEAVWFNSGHGIYLFKHMWDGFNRQTERGEPKWHPTQKPIALMMELMERLSLERETVVLDPYMGSGPVGIACAKTGRKFIGIELDESYCEIARRRIVEARMQGNLFKGVGAVSSAGKG